MGCAGFWEHELHRVEDEWRRELLQGVRVERLDHLRSVAGICREIGLAARLDPILHISVPPCSFG